MSTPTTEPERRRERRAAVVRKTLSVVAGSGRAVGLILGMVDRETADTASVCFAIAVFAIKVIEALAVPSRVRVVPDRAGRPNG